ncbi:PQQ-binding-like beta-propeller repeat protein [Isoptericola sp. b408]|uniref:outer membrane protein assembly factor BamB family protein n=1 Tax=Isoptericola sp. b408 TaxID=3064653 RepID=UPI0027137E4E|nr:PQQ-binding-like beta-propeller repeat protein [Isoptericola sp. b408]MDO8149881.1 PQQ-binding-like beta-propeller repeat protein [Isoptericola sp. b408]
MGRQRGGEVVTFDVSHDAVDPDATGHPDGGPAPGRTGRTVRAVERWRRAGRRQRRTALGIAAVAVLVLAGGAVAAGALADHVETDRLRTAPGGVLSLDGALTEVWHADVDGLATVLPDGGLAVVRGADLVALEVATGAERWRTTLDDRLECGPRPRLGSGVEWTIPVGTVTCVHGSDGARAVTVLDADGDVVGRRDLDDDRYGGPLRAVAPAAHGGLLVAEHDSDLPAQVTFASRRQVFAELLRPGLEPGSTQVRLEDALTGERRQTLDLAALSDVVVSDCYDLGADGRSGDAVPGPGGRAVLDLGVLLGTPSMVAFDGCAVDGGATYDGVPLGYATDRSTWPDDPVRQPAPGDRFVVPQGSGTIVQTDDGNPLLELPDLRVEVPATDGSSGSGQVAVGTDRVVALADDGTQRWEAAMDDPQVLVRTADVVVAGGWNLLAAYDPADGSELWSLAPDAGPRRYVLSATTDGERMTGVLLEFPATGPATFSLFTIDLRTGREVAPRVPLGDGRLGETGQLVAVDGHLLVPEFADREAMTAGPGSAVVGLTVLAPEGV